MQPITTLGSPHNAMHSPSYNVHGGCLYFNVDVLYKDSPGCVQCLHLVAMLPFSQAVCVVSIYTMAFKNFLCCGDLP